MAITVYFAKYRTGIPSTGTEILFKASTEYRYRGTFILYRTHLCYFYLKQRKIFNLNEEELKALNNLRQNHSIITCKPNTVIKIKFSLYSLNTLSGSRVSGAHLCGFAPGPTFQRLQRWWVVGNVWEIWSARDMNPIPPVPDANVLPLVTFNVDSKGQILADNIGGSI